MNAKERLQQVRCLDFEIHLLEAEGKKTAELLENLTKHNNGGKGTAAAIIALMELALKIDDCLSRLDAISKDIRKSIDTLRDPNHRHILIMRYFLCMEWWKIAAEISYSERHTFKLHNDALVELDIIIAHSTPSDVP